MASIAVPPLSPPPPLQAIAEEEEGDEGTNPTPAGTPSPRMDADEGEKNWSIPPYLLLIMLCGGMTVSAVLSTLSSEHLKSLHFRAPLVLGGVIPLGTGLVGILTGGLSNRRGPLQAHAVCGGFVFAAFWLSALAQTSLSSERFLLLKASRLLPTMLIGLTILNKRYLLVDWIAGLLAILGLALTSASSSGSKTTSALSSSSSGLAVSEGTTAGYVAITASLFLDGFYSNAQASLCAHHGAKAKELAAGGMTFATLFFAAAVLADATSRDAVARAFAEPHTVGLWLLLFTASNVLGSFSALLLVESFGAASAGFSSVVAKSASIGVLLFLFPRDVGLQAYLGIALVFGAVLLSSVAKAPGAKLALAASGEEEEEGDEEDAEAGQGGHMLEEEEEEDEEEAAARAAAMLSGETQERLLDLEGGEGEGGAEEAELEARQAAMTMLKAAAVVAASGSSSSAFDPSVATGAASMPLDQQQQSESDEADSSSSSSRFTSPVSIRSATMGPRLSLQHQHQHHSGGGSNRSAPNSGGSAVSRTRTVKSPFLEEQKAAAPASSSTAAADQQTAVEGQGQGQGQDGAPASSLPPLHPQRPTTNSTTRLTRTSSISAILLTQLPKLAGIERPNKPTLDRLSPLAVAAPLPGARGSTSVATGTRKAGGGVFFPAAAGKGGPSSVRGGVTGGGGGGGGLTTRSLHYARHSSTTIAADLVGERRSPLSGRKIRGPSAGGLPLRPKSVSVLGLGSGERGEEDGTEQDPAAAAIASSALVTGGSTNSMPEKLQQLQHKLQQRRNSTGTYSHPAAAAAALAAALAVANSNETGSPTTSSTKSNSETFAETVSGDGANLFAPPLRSSQSAPEALNEAAGAQGGGEGEGESEDNSTRSRTLPALPPLPPTPTAASASTGMSMGMGTSSRSLSRDDEGAASSPASASALANPPLSPEDAVYMLAAGLRHRSGRQQSSSS